MSKHKKTREQKRKADERNGESISHMQHVSSSPTYVFSAGHVPAQSIAKSEQHINTIALTQHDVRKTAIISLIIVALQLAFFFLLKNHMLAIGFVRY